MVSGAIRIAASAEEARGGDFALLLLSHAHALNLALVFMVVYAASRGLAASELEAEEQMSANY